MIAENGQNKRGIEQCLYLQQDNLWIIDIDRSTPADSRCIKIDFEVNEYTSSILIGNTIYLWISNSIENKI